MKLEVNLSDREEIEAAHALLAAILGGAVAQMTVTQQVGDMSVSTTGTPAQLQAVGVIMPADNPSTGERPAAEVFGGAPAALPLGIPAPSIAGVGLPPSAPVGQPPIGMPVPGLPVPAAVIAPAVHAQAHAAAALSAHAATGPVDLDAEGIPWDARIHASTKVKTQKNVWKARKGLNDDTLVNRVKAELRAQVAQSAAPLPVTPPAASLPVAPVAPSVPMPASPPQGDPTTFETLMPRVSAATMGGILPPTALAQVMVAISTHYQRPDIATVTALSMPANEGWIPVVYATLKQHFPAFN